MNEKLGKMHQIVRDPFSLSTPISKLLSQFSGIYFFVVVGY